MKTLRKTNTKEAVEVSEDKPVKSKSLSNVDKSACQNENEVINTNENSVSSVTEEDRHAYFESRLNEFQNMSSYQELENFVFSIKDETLHKFGDLSMNASLNILEKKLIGDAIAQKLLPDDLPDNVASKIPVCITGDGNCLPRCGSLLVFGSQDYHIELRCRIVMELVEHGELYLSLPHLCKGLSDDTPQKEKENLLKTYTMFSEQYTPGDVLTENVMRRIFQSEILSVSKTNEFMGIWQLFGLSSVIRCKILSVYPKLGSPVCHQTLHRMIFPREMSQGDTAAIMWSTTRTDMFESNWQPNHFVPFVRLTSGTTEEPTTSANSILEDSTLNCMPDFFSMELPDVSSSDSFEIDPDTMTGLMETLFKPVDDTSDAVTDEDHASKMATDGVNASLVFNDGENASHTVKDGDDSHVSHTLTVTSELVSDSGLSIHVGTHVLIKHGAQLLPAVVEKVDEPFLWVCFFKKQNGNNWTMEEQQFTIVKSDIEKILDPPDIVLYRGSRFVYKFSF